VVGVSQLTLPSGASDSLDSEVCSNSVTIRNDENLEFDELFMVVLNSSDRAVNINTDFAVVTILEDTNDGMYFRPFLPHRIIKHEAVVVNLGSDGKLVCANIIQSSYHTIPCFFSGILSIYTPFSLSISHTGIEVGLQQTAFTVTEGVNETVTVCVEFLAGDTLEKNVTVVLTTQDGSATGQGRDHSIMYCFHEWIKISILTSSCWFYVVASPSQPLQISTQQQLLWDLLQVIWQVPVFVQTYAW